MAWEKVVREENGGEQALGRREGTIVVVGDSILTTAC